MRFSRVLLLVGLIGCGQDICIRNSDCVLGEVCGVKGVCAVAEDAGVSDAIEPDGTPKDADIEDDAALDAGVDAATDAATTDGGP